MTTPAHEAGGGVAPQAFGQMYAGTGLLGAFMFTGPQLDPPAGTLSGGEKTRLALAGLVASTANVLLLADEDLGDFLPGGRGGG